MIIITCKGVILEGNNEKVSRPNAVTALVC
jgi:hypothetical protein